MIVIDDKYMHIVECYKTGGYTDRDMISFLPNHKKSEEIVVVGMCPSHIATPKTNGSFATLKRWMTKAGVSDWDFQNVVPHKENVAPKDISKEIYYDLLKNRLCSFKKVVALGNDVSNALNKIKIDHIKVYHPSPRNRALNDKNAEIEVVSKIKRYVND